MLICVIYKSVTVAGSYPSTLDFYRVIAAVIFGLENL